MIEFVTIPATAESSGKKLKFVQAPSPQSNYSYSDGVLTVDSTPHTVGGGILAGIFGGLTENDAQGMVAPPDGDYYDYVNETYSLKTGMESLATAISKAHAPDDPNPDIIIIIIEIIDEED